RAGQPYLDEIRWLVVPEETTAYAAFQSKQLDLLSALTHQDAQDVIARNPQAKPVEYLQPIGFQLYLTQAKPSPLNDFRVRKALALSIDRDEMMKVVSGGKGAWAVSGAMYGLFSDAEAHQLLKDD